MKQCPSPLQNSANTQGRIMAEKLDPNKDTATIVVDPEKCRQDGICVEACPFGIFAETLHGVPEVVDRAGELCINCGHCVAICPGEAISVKGLGAEDCDPVDRELAVTREQVVQLFRSRRSIRSYKDEPVDRQALESLLDMARWAPTAKNLQPLHWIVLQNRAEISRLAGMVVDWMRDKGIQPDVVKAYDKGWDIIHRNAPCLLIAHASSQGIKPVEDCTIALATVEAAAPAFGLGACWAGFFMSAAREHQPILDVLDLPLDHQVYGALMLGQPRFRYRWIPPRDEAKVEWR